MVERKICWWDRHPFNGDIFRIPIWYGKYRVRGWGVYCSVACMLAECDDRKNDETFNKALQYIRRVISLSGEAKDIFKAVKKAPHFTTIGDEYKTINEFRQTFIIYESHPRFLHYIPCEAFTQYHITKYNTTPKKTIKKSKQKRKRIIPKQEVINVADFE